MRKLTPECTGQCNCRKMHKVCGRLSSVTAEKGNHCPVSSTLDHEGQVADAQAILWPTVPWREQLQESAWSSMDSSHRTSLLVPASLLPPHYQGCHTIAEADVIDLSGKI